MIARRLGTALAAAWLFAGAAYAAPATDGSCPAGESSGVSTLASDVSAVAGATTAPDGYSRNATSDAAPRSLAEAAARATRLDVPYRVQEGPTCGLYALGMVMDYYHQLDASNAVPFVQPGDATRHGAANFRPSTSARLFDVAKKNGYFAESQRIVHADGGMFVADQLGQLATKFGYSYRLTDNAGAADVRAAIDRGHPALVGFDVDANGNPTSVGGTRAHWGVVVGHFQYGGEEWFVAHHGWEAKDYLWRASDLEASMRQIQPTLGPKIVEILPRTH